MSERVTAIGATTTLADRKRRAGQRLLIGISGHAITDDERRLIAELRPAGFVLFARNVAEPEQVRELNRELSTLVDPHDPALLTVDQEGGRVQRVRAPATVWPAMRVLGRGPDRTAEVSRAMALELRALGFNLNFAPVADVDSNPDNPVIGDRSFGRDPARVAEHVAAFVTSHQEAGVVACAKHFPGHGDTSVDSHHALPVVEREEPDVRACELIPFQHAVAAGVGSVMTSHVVFPTWDEDWPATLSDRIIERLLRAELRYDGVVFSDDMEMKAVADRWPVSLQVERATRAGVDALLVCADPERQFAMYRALVQVQEDDPGLHTASEDAVKRIDRMRERFLLDRLPAPELATLGAPEHVALAAELEAYA